MNKEANPELSVSRILHRLYPYTSFLTKDGQNMVEDLLKSFDIKNNISADHIPAAFSQRNIDPVASGSYVPTDYHQHVVHELEESIQIHDICLMGARGSGKSTLIKQLADRLSLELEPLMLYLVFRI